MCLLNYINLKFLKQRCTGKTVITSHTKDNKSKCEIETLELIKEIVYMWMQAEELHNCLLAWPPLLNEGGRAFRHDGGSSDVLCSRLPTLTSENFLNCCFTASI